MKRTIVATALLSGLIAAQAASPAPVTVVEYYNRTLNTYFITGRTAEQQMLDQVADFARTGMSFQARSTDDVQPASVGICRFYVSIASPFTNSHFFGRQQVDCEPMAEAAYAGFSWEGYDFRVPGSEGDGTCPEGATPVYRSFRLGSDGVTSKPGDHRPRHRGALGGARGNRQVPHRAERHAPPRRRDRRDALARRRQSVHPGPDPSHRALARRIASRRQVRLPGLERACREGDRRERQQGPASRCGLAARRHRRPRAHAHGARRAC